MELLVSEPLQIYVHPKSLNFQAGDSFSVTCEVSTVPTEFFWKQDGYILPKKDSEHITIEDVGHRLILHVKNAKPADESVYQCIGINNKESGNRTLLIL